MTKEAMTLAVEALKNLIPIGKRTADLQESAIKDLEEALAKQEQRSDSEHTGEPVAWMRQDGQRVTTASDRHNYPDYETRYSIPLYTTPQPKQEQGEPVALVTGVYAGRFTYAPFKSSVLLPVGMALYSSSQPAQKPLMLEKFREMEALLDDSNAPQHKTITNDELKIIMETTMPVIDWKARYGVELNNGERNKWMLEWFIAFARAIEAAHGIKE